MRSERDKMLAGELYSGMDPELVAARSRCRRLLREYEATDPDDAAGRAAILARLFGAVGPGAIIEPPFRCDYGVYTTIGARFYANFGCVILDCNRVTIGDDVLFAPNVQLYTAEHPVDAEQRARGPELARPITIGDKVWLGGGAIVLPGVTIGAGTTIGAGAVVTRDVPAGVLAAGNPCKVIRVLNLPETR